MKSTTDWPRLASTAAARPRFENWFQLACSTAQATNIICYGQYFARSTKRSPKVVGIYINLLYRLSQHLIQRPQHINGGGQTLFDLARSPALGL